MPFRLALALLALLAVPTANATAPAAQYHLTVTEAALHAAETPSLDLVATLDLRDGRLAMSPMGPLPERWPTFIADLTVEALDGTLLPVAASEAPGWTVDAPDQPIRIRYTVQLDHERLEWPGGIDGVAFVRDWGAFLTGRAVFVTSPEAEAAPDGKAFASVRISLPDDWIATTPWAPAEAADTWHVETATALTESLLMLGTHTERVLARGPLALRFAVAGEANADRAEAFAAQSGAILDYYTDLMGGLPAPPPDRPLSTIVVTVAEAASTDGEVIGNHISMLLEADNSPENATFGWLLFAHEVFHLWNGATLRVADSQADWFKEGVTSYYTLKALHHVGLLPEVGVLGVLDGLFYARYRADEGYGTLSMREAASGFDKDNHWGLVYGGGLFAGLCIDLQVREATANARSLDDLMRDFYTEHAGNDRTYTTDDVLAAANSLSGRDVTPFFDDHIRGMAPVPVAECLARTALDVTTETGRLVATPNPEASALEVALWEGVLGR
ncbi:MAG: hypothetical protein Rubg2KO_40840 [Rubricoccaceae bacterium]